MSEDTGQDDLDTKEGDEKAGPEHTPQEQRAMELGWKPQDDYEGNADYISAEAWIARTPLFEKIDEQKRKYQNLEKSFRNLQEHYNKVEDRAHERAIKELREKKTAAIKDDDLDRAALIDAELDDLRDKPPEKLEIQTDMVDESKVWLEKNKWYNEDKAMQNYADKLLRGAAAIGDPLSSALDEVEREVKLRFPDKFKNPARQQANRVEDGSTRKGSSKATSRFELTDDEERVMKSLVAQGVLTREKYIEDIKKVRGDE